MQYSIREIRNILQNKQAVIKDYQISILLTDSRIVSQPAESLFFALETKNGDGHKYVEELYKAGVRCFVVKKIEDKWQKYNDANFIIVKDTLAALQKLASAHRARFNIPIIGITGSNGKTIVKEWLYQLLRDDYSLALSPRSFNSQLGVPLSVWQINENTTLGIFEAGISEPEEMSKLEAVIEPTIGIFTNIGQAHQEGFKSMKQKCLEKLDLFIHSDIIICEEENELIEECMEIACLSQKRFTWSRKRSEKSPVHINKIEQKATNTKIQFAVLGLESEIEIPFTDTASIENAIHVLTTAIYLRLSQKTLVSKMKTLEPVAMRLDVRDGINNCTIINDTYNSDLNSLTLALNFLSERATNKSLKKTLILSDIHQSGIPSNELYLLTAKLLASKDIDYFVGIGPEISQHKHLFKKIKADFYVDADSFIKSDSLDELKDMCILLKGVRSFHFDSISKELEIKKHETILEVNLNAIIHNFQHLKKNLDPKTKVICMLKADGYGAGSAEIAKTLQYHNADYIAVALSEEGITLRKDGIKIPIIVLNSEVGGFLELYDNYLEPEVYSIRHLRSFIEEARAIGTNKYAIHIKLDTGMHRLGFYEENIPEMIALLKKQPCLKVASVFSHLAASDNPEYDDFTRNQIELFKRLSTEIEKQLGYKVKKHILNSAGIERFPEAQFDMVRLGISLYGISASGIEGLKNVHTLKTTILQIKEVKAAETVGYNRNGKLSSDRKIAIIRIGYGDGLDRMLGNGTGEVFVQGQLAPYIGNICMDLSMIDITNIPDVREGDCVEVLGPNIPVTELANKIGTIPYEILTNISTRVKQVYYKE